MTPDGLNRKRDESSAVVSVGNSQGYMFQEPQQGLWEGLFRRLNKKITMLRKQKSCCSLPETVLTTSEVFLRPTKENW